MASAPRPWTPAHAAAALAALLVLEWVSLALWRSLSLTSALSALIGAFPGVLAWAFGPLDTLGGEALKEAAAQGWVGLTRVLGLLFLLVAGLRWGHPLRMPGRDPVRAAGAAFCAGGAFLCVLLVLDACQGGGVFRLMRGPQDPVFSRPGAFVAAYLVMVLLGPLQEEILFRGVLLDALRPLGRAAAVVLSALLFAAFHPLAALAAGKPPELPMVQFAGGLAFACLALRTGGLLAPWILHAAANGFLLSLQVLLQR